MSLFLTLYFRSIWNKFAVSCVNEHFREDTIKTNSIEWKILNDSRTELAHSDDVHYDIGDSHFRATLYQSIHFHKNKIMKRIMALVLVSLTFSMLWEATAFNENIYALSNRASNGPSSPGTSELHPSNTGPASGPSSGIHPSNTGPASGPSSAFILPILVLLVALPQAFILLAMHKQQLFLLLLTTVQLLYILMARTPQLFNLTIAPLIPMDILL